MSSLETVESLMSRLPCPICLNSRIMVNLSCESYHAPCDIQATCRHCNHKFVVTEDPKTMDSVWEKFKEVIDKMACAKCGDEKLTLEFLCDRGTEDCFLLARCEDHNHANKINHQGLRYLFA